MWNSPIPQNRWLGLRRINRGPEAFVSLAEFEKAFMDELVQGLPEHDAATLGRLLSRGRKVEIEVFVRTHGPNPIFDPQQEIEVPVGVAKADVVSISEEPSMEAIAAVMEGRVVHILFQAGDATRFQQGPFYSLNPFNLTKTLIHRRAVHTNGSNDEEGASLNETDYEELKGLLVEIEKARIKLPAEAASILIDWPLGPKQPLFVRAAIRRVIQDSLESGRLKSREAMNAYRKALLNQKLLFFVSRRGGLGDLHDQTLRKDQNFFGFDPQNVVTIEQELARGVTADDRGKLSFLEGEDCRDANGHLYALIQSARNGDFTTYTESGRPIKPMEMDALSYFFARGGRYLSIIRINDMDRQTTEIVNAKALSNALKMFDQGYMNVIETVANPKGQKGGTGITFGDPDIHMLTETHENSFPALSRAFETAMQAYLRENNGNHPAYNAMRQWSVLEATRIVLRKFGGRIVFVPRRKIIGDTLISYLGVDMPMGDLSLLCSDFKSRMFQFKGPSGGELLIHDMKQKENLPVALRTLHRQLKDPHIIDAALEMASKKSIPFRPNKVPVGIYGAPAPEFD